METADEEKLSTEIEWELCKENVQPLKQGRKFANLSLALHTDSEDQANKIKEQKLQFETELRRYKGEDPLDVWYRYVNWTEQNFPKGGKGSNLSVILQKCVAQFTDEERYKNDKRYVDVWIKFAMQCNDPLELFNFMFDNGIGTKLEIFYESWAWELERLGSTKKADAIFSQGIQMRAEPVELLIKKHKEFQVRVTRKTLQDNENHEEAETPQRTVFGKLEGQGKKGSAPVDRRSNLERSGLKGLGENASRKSHNSSNVGQFTVYSENDSSASAPQVQRGEWKHSSSHVKDKENMQKPGIWTNQKVKQRSVQHVTESSVAKKPSFTVHEDEHADQQMVTPRKVYVDTNKHVLSAKKVHDPFYHFQHMQQDPKQKPMYPKHLVYTGTEEFSLEELRAPIWREEQKAKEIQEREEKLMQQQEEIARQRKEMIEQQKRLQQEREEMEKLLQLQKEALISCTVTSNNCFRNNDSEEMQQQSFQKLPVVNTNSGASDTNQISQTIPKQNNSEASGMFSKTSLKRNLFSSQEASSASSLNSISSRENSTEEITPNSLLCPPRLKLQNQQLTATFSHSFMKPRKSCLMNSSSTNVSLNTIGSSGGHQNSTKSINPTPDSSFMRSSLRGTPGTGGSISAPSPTVNTKEAMQTVMTMFNKTLDMEKNFGWDVLGPSKVDVEDEFAADSQSQGAGFTIFSDPCTEAPLNQPEPPFTIYTEDCETNSQKAENKPVASAPFTIFEDSASSNHKNANKIEVREEDFCNDENMLPMEDRMDVAEDKAYEMPLPKDNDAEMTEIVACNKMNAEDDIDLNFECGNDFTFLPNCYSTCNFTEAARLASTPFNPDQKEPLPKPPVSNIKSIIPNETGYNGMNFTDNNMKIQSTVNLDNYNMGEACPITSEQTSSSGNCQSTNAVEENHSSSQLRRSSIFITKQDGLSPIMEQSDEDAKSQASSCGSHSSGTYPNAFSNSNMTHHASHSHIGTNQMTHLSSVAEESSQLVAKEEESKSVLINNLEASLLKAQLEGAGNRSMHEIDITNYVPPELDEKTERLMNMSVMIDDSDPFDEEKNSKFLSKLCKPLNSYPNYHVIDGNIPNIEPGKVTALGENVYSFETLLGEGSYAKVYKANIVEDSEYDLEETESKVVKVQKPACPWEFYITSECHNRLSQINTDYVVRPSIMKVDQFYIYKDGSCLVNEMHQYGTLLDFVNLHLKAKIKVAEEMVIMVTIEMLRMAEQMQQIGVIHGDIKPDNFLITSVPEQLHRYTKDFRELIGEKSKIIKLIDFGRSIDLKLYPKGTTFTTKVTTSGFQCIEMRTDRPWTYQTDLFGIAGSVHVMMFGEYMKVVHETSGWKITGAIRRYNFACDAWKKLFHMFLNVPNCEELPDLAKLRKEFEELLLHRLQDSKARSAFEDYLRDVALAYWNKN